MIQIEKRNLKFHLKGTKVIIITTIIIIMTKLYPKKNSTLIFFLIIKWRNGTVFWLLCKRSNTVRRCQEKAEVRGLKIGSIPNALARPTQVNYIEYNNNGFHALASALHE